MNSERTINYTNRDFSGIKEQLITLAKNYFPDTYTDFTATSPGMMFIEMAAYVGDILSFYQDKQLQETFLQYAQNPKGLYSLAYMMGYRPKVTTVSTVELSMFQEVSAISSSAGIYPDWSQAAIVGEGATVNCSIPNNQSFITEDPVDFSFSSSLDPTTITALYSGEDETNPDSFLLEKKVKAYSGTIKTITKTFGAYEKYPTFEIEDSNIVGILDVHELGTNDESGEWVEVPFLGQDTVFKATPNEGENADTVPYIISLKKVPKRFVTRFNSKGNLEIQFGAGMYADDQDEENFLPDPLSLRPGIQENPAANKFDTAYDPSNFLFTKSYGLVPTSTTLVFRYVTGGGVTSNVPANVITVPGTGFPAGASITVTNQEASTGGRDGDSLEEIKENSMRAFAEQKRAVTLKDLNIRALSMPVRFGTVAKVYAMKDNILGGDERDPLNISLYLLGMDTEGHLVLPNDTLKQNLKTYLSDYTMLTDTIDLKDAYVINIGIQYDVVLRRGFSSTDVLLRCNRILQNYFNTKNRAINETINLVEIQNLLNQVLGVQVVKDVKVVNKVGVEGNLEYSEYAYDVKAATRNGIVYPSYDISFFEVKYPDVDIEGRIVTL